MQVRDAGEASADVSACTASCLCLAHHLTSGRQHTCQGAGLEESALWWVMYEDLAGHCQVQLGAAVSAKRMLPLHSCSMLSVSTNTCSA